MPEYIPTLGEYAEIIHWLVAHPNEEVPKEMRRAFDDAIDRAELRVFAAELARSVDEDDQQIEAADWQMRYFDRAVEHDALVTTCQEQLRLATREDAEVLVKNGWRPRSE